MPDFVEARNNLANSLIEQGELDEALDQLRSVLNLKPNWVDPMNNLAFLMSTHPELKKRDVNEATRLARRACELTDFKNPQPLGTLAAAYASAGRFSEAIETANTAVKLADAANQPQIKNILQYHLTFYTQGKPYIEPAPQPLSNPVNPKP
jgi:Flp pilus assembly protein TadD